MLPPPRRPLLVLVVLIGLCKVVRCDQAMDIGTMEEVVGGCHLISGLTRSQRRVCSRSPTSAAAALQGLKMAVKECQHQMRWHRWNCSTLESRKLNPHAATMMKRGYKESAFAYAMASAGVAHAVARACAQGLLLACSCDPNAHRFPRDRRQLPKDVVASPGGGGVATPSSGVAYGWKWGGCSHNVDYGAQVSRAFLDSREKAGDLHSNVNLHNNEAGRLAVSSNMEVRCKCHGTSGSCQLRTCWRAVPDFRAVGKQLKAKYRSALMVGQSNEARDFNGGNGVHQQAPPSSSMALMSNDYRRNSGGGSRRMRDRSEADDGRRRRRPGGRKRGGGRRSERRERWRQRSREQPKDALLYYERSPNYCERDPELDVPGTSGRRCARPKDARGSCDALCCGRGYNRLRARTVQRCRCRFHWCCRVDCDTCVEEDFVAVCK